MTNDPTTRAAEAAAATIRGHAPRVDHRAELIEEVRAAVSDELQRPTLTRMPDDVGPELTPSESLLAAALAALPDDRARAVVREAAARLSLATLDLDIVTFELGGGL